VLDVWDGRIIVWPRPPRPGRCAARCARRGGSVPVDRPGRARTDPVAHRSPIGV